MFVEELLRTFPSLDTKFSASNHVASSWETPAIREIITQRREQLSHLDTIIQRVETILHQFREKREQVESSLKAHEGFISSIRRLPSEILVKIFMRCLPDERYLSPDRDNAPLLLTRICRRWRAIALDTPRLWSSLSITVLWESPEKQVSRYHEYWLKNARMCSLSLHLHWWPAYGSSVGMAAADLLRGYTTRCTDLRIFFSSTHGLDHLLEETPLLERLSLTGDLMAFWSEGKVSIAQSSHRLRTLIIDTAGVPDLELFSDRLILPWANLTQLSVVFRSDDEEITDASIFTMILEMCPNLEYFVYSPLAICKSQDTVSLTHPNLRVLDICEPYSDGQLLDKLTFPNLRHLRVHKHVEDVNTDLEEISVPEVSSLEGSGHHAFDMAIRGDIHHVRTLFEVFNPGWMGLTHVRLQSDYPMKDFSFMIPLQRCLSLEDLVVDYISVTKEPEYTPLTHLTLSSLTLVVNFGDFGSLLDLLTLPSLCHLRVNIKHPYPSRWPHSNVKELISRSNCPLETLKVGGPKLSLSHCEELASFTLSPSLFTTIFSLTDFPPIDSFADVTLFSRHARDTALFKDFSIKDKPFTLLVPTDQALTALTGRQSEQLSRDVERWVAAHTIPSRISLLEVPVTYETMLEGKSVTFTPVKGEKASSDWSGVTLEDGVRIIEMKEGVNGVIFVIDGTIKP